MGLLPEEAGIREGVPVGLLGGVIFSAEIIGTVVFGVVLLLVSSKGGIGFMPVMKVRIS